MFNGAHTASGVNMLIAQHITHIASELEVFSFVMPILILFNKINLKLETMMPYAYDMRD
jgi:hypothetical protein